MSYVITFITGVLMGAFTMALVSINKDMEYTVTPKVPEEGVKDADR